MYWYISFLRPPPVSVSSAAETIVITPQVANDLRTELKYEPTTILYKWQRLLPTPLPPAQSEELTIFEPPMSTYKPLSIPLPPKIQAGESWRLGLFAHDSHSDSVDIDNHGEGCSSLLSLVDDRPPVLGVWSEGIHIVRPDIRSSGITKSINGNGKNATAIAIANVNKRDIVNGGSSPSSSSKKGQGGYNSKEKGKGKGKEKEKEKDDGPKQGRITREFALPDAAGGGTLRIVEQTSFDLDKKIWDSGLALSAWLWKYLPAKPRNKVPHSLAERVVDLVRRDEPLRILEIGSGTGLVSIALTLALRAHHPQSSRYITATDLGSAIPLMEENLSLNGLSSAPANSSLGAMAVPDDGSSVTATAGGAATAAAADSRTRLDAKVLDWDEELPSWVGSEWPELILAADVTYNTSAFPSLLSTLTSLLNPSSPSIISSASSPSQESDRPPPFLARPLLLLAYKQRDPAERDLWDMLRDEGVGMVLVDKVIGAEEEGETEIWVGSMGLDVGVGAGPGQ
ncbi:hypothetical protein IAU59_001714 [Kwoniella sp. CBS 9459]